VVLKKNGELAASDHYGVLADLDVIAGDGGRDA
jgi:hypothetical protein